MNNTIEIQDIQVYKNDTKKIESTYKVLQIVNILLGVVSTLGGLTMLIFGAIGYEDLLYVGIVMFIISPFIAIVSGMILNVAFGAFYDLRKLRLNTEALTTSPKTQP